MSRWFDNLHPGLRSFWQPVASVAELNGPGPHPVTLLGEDYALARLGEAWTLLPDRCPHRLAPLTAGRVVDARLECGYHGWCFDAAGSCVAIPALGPDAAVPPTAHLRSPWGVEERYGIIWVAIAEPQLPIPTVDEWDDARFGRAPMPVQAWSAGAAQMTDNFLDVAHFPFTHLGTIGDPDEVEVGAIEIEREGWYFDATYRHHAKSIEDQTDGTAAADAALVERVMRFRCWAPHHLKLYIDYGPDGDLVLYFFHQPVDRETTRLYCLILAENLAPDYPEAGRMTPEEQIAFQLEVAREDRGLLEQLRVKGVPLDPGVESHTRADRTTVEYRRLLDAVDRCVAEVAG